MPDPDRFARLRSAVDDVTFPASKREVLDAASGKSVRLEDRTLSVADMLAHVPYNEFQDEDEFVARVCAYTPGLDR